nr:DUF11 domain-containing protein [Chloroflexota bacterium]
MHPDRYSKPKYILSRLGLFALLLGLLWLGLCTVQFVGSEHCWAQDIAFVTPTPAPLPALFLAISDQRDPVPAQWRLRYTIRVENPNACILSSVWVTDILPIGTYFVSADTGGIYGDGVVTWTIASLAWDFAVDLHLELGTYSWLEGVITNTVVAIADGTLPVTHTETTTIVAATPTPAVISNPLYTPTSTSTRTPTPTPTSTRTPTPTPTSTRTPTPTPTSTPIPTSTPTRTPTWTPTPIDVSIPTPEFTPVLPSLTPVSSVPVHFPPVIFVMLDWMNGDWSNPNYYMSWINRFGGREEVRGHPEWGALGGWWEFVWAHLNPYKGVYDWTKTDEYILKAQRMRVTLPDGSVIAKPVGIAVTTWTFHETDEQIGVNWTPSWVASMGGGSITSCYDPDGPSGPCKPMCTPNFGNTVWQYWFDQFILAMGQHYDNNPDFYNLAWINIATGVDEETMERKNVHGCTYDIGNSPAFNNWVDRVMGTYNLAFPNTPQFIQSTLHGIHYHCALAASFPSKMTGVKVNAWEVDSPNAEIRYDGVLVGGVTGFSQLYHELIPTAFEPGGAVPRVNGAYWMFMEGLSVHPYILDVQYPNIAEPIPLDRSLVFPFLISHVSIWGNQCGMRLMCGSCCARPSTLPLTVAGGLAMASTNAMALITGISCTGCTEGIRRLGAARWHWLGMR